MSTWITGLYNVVVGYMWWPGGLYMFWGWVLYVGRPERCFSSSNGTSGSLVCRVLQIILCYNARCTGQVCTVHNMHFMFCIVDTVY